MAFWASIQGKTGERLTEFGTASQKMTSRFPPGDLLFLSEGAIISYEEAPRLTASQNPKGPPEADRHPLDRLCHLFGRQSGAKQGDGTR
jgi:hypothetical protein